MNHYFTNNTDLKSELRTLNYIVNNETFTFLSDNGVFSKNRIDFGTSLLLDEYLKETDKRNKKVLDVGCGYGVIGIVISKINDSFSTLIDVNKRSVHLTKLNIDKNKVNAKVFYSDAYENIEDKYDVIITNPPIRAGNKIVLNILLNAKDHLNKNGELWCVIRKDQGANTFIKKLKNDYTVEIIKKYKGYYIIKAKID